MTIRAPAAPSIRSLLGIWFTLLLRKLMTTKRHFMNLDDTSNNLAFLSSAKQSILFFVKGFCLVGLLFILSRFESTLPAVIIALVWAILSSISSIGLAYHVVIRKIHKQLMYIDGAPAGKVNEGRFLSLLVSFVLSALLISSLMIEAVKWSAEEWIILLVSVPLFYVAMYASKQLSKMSYEPLYRRSKATLISTIIVGSMLCVICFAISSLMPPTTYASAAEAFLAARNPFDQSPSFLLYDAGLINAFINGSVSFALSQVAESSMLGYILLKGILDASALFGFANLLGTCSISATEFKRVFQPLSSAKDTKANQAVVPKYIAFACIFPLMLTIAFPVCDLVTKNAAETEEFNSVESFIQDKIGIAVYYLDGKYYDQQAVNALIAEAKQKSQNISSEATEKLVPLINDAYDKRIENIDAYLEWYYSLPADYDRLIQFFTGSIEDGMKAQLNEKINMNIEDSELAKLYDEYIQQTTELKADVTEKLSEYELEDIPAFLIVDETDLSSDFLAESMKPAEQLLDSRLRLGISSVTGLSSGVITKSVTERILASQTVEKMTNRLITKLGASGIVKLTTSAGGTALAPGVGTVAGIGIGVLSDYLFLKADEALNRDTYKQELIDAIEEDRRDKLALIQPVG